MGIIEDQESFLFNLENELRRASVLVNKAAGIVEAVRKLNSLLYESQTKQSCKVCGAIDCFNFHVNDDIWEKVVPSSYQDKVVCLKCFDKFAKEKGIEYSNALDSLYFAGEQESITFRSKS